MNQTELMTKANRALSQTKFQLKKKSPEILVVAGIVGAVASAVLACKATTKAGKVVEKTKGELDVIHESKNTGVTPAGETYNNDDYKKDLTITYVHTGVEFAKLYGPAVILGAASITSILASHNIMRKRNVALAAAYATIDKSFKEYRGRVVDRFGEVVDKELRYNLKAKEVKETVVDEDGNEKKVKKTVHTAGPLGNSDYACFFDESSRHWEKNGEYNLMFLRAQQQRANDRLRSRGYLFLNEVYYSLGLRETKAGQSVGWIYDPSDKHNGDNYVDFGIMEIDRDACENPDEEPERTILLDFNVDGNIMNLFEQYDSTF